MVIKRKSAMVIKRRSAMVIKTKKGVPQMMEPNSLSEVNAGAPVPDVIATVAPCHEYEYTTRMMQTLSGKGANATNAALHNPVEDDDAW